MKFKTIELPDMVGKTLQEVKDYLEKEYPNQLAKEEHQEEYIKSNSKLPDWTWCFFFGSVLRYSPGHWDVPCARWGGSWWNRDANCLASSWHSDYRVVLLESPSDLNLESLNLRLENLETKISKIIKILSE